MVTPVKEKIDKHRADVVGLLTSGHGVEKTSEDLNLSTYYVKRVARKLRAEGKDLTVDKTITASRRKTNNHQVTTGPVLPSIDKPRPRVRTVEDIEAVAACLGVSLTPLKPGLWVVGKKEVTLQQLVTIVNDHLRRRGAEPIQRESDRLTYTGGSLIHSLLAVAS